MKDIYYFLEAEKNYSEPELDYLEDSGEFGSADDPLYFLSKKDFERCKTPNPKGHYSKHGLSDVEIMIFQVFIGRLSSYFRGDRYGAEIPDLVKEMRAILESVILKAPTFRGDILYRFCTDDPIDFRVDDIYEPPHSLTTTKDNWGKDTNVYIITPSHKTKARSLYEFYNHGEEYQVNFPSGTKFKITDIQDYGEFKKIYMSEVS